MACTYNRLVLFFNYCYLYHCYVELLHIKSLVDSTRHCTIPTIFLQCPLEAVVLHKDVRHLKYINHVFSQTSHKINAIILPQEPAQISFPMKVHVYSVTSPRLPAELPATKYVLVFSNHQHTKSSYTYSSNKIQRHIHNIYISSLAYT